jgi:hypothetical protein
MISITDKLIELGIQPLDGEAFTPFSEQEVARIEAAIGVPLPVTYERFLTRFGRSMFSTEVNCTPSSEPLYFGWFFGFSDLLDAIDNLKDFLPETIIPIGEDGGANLFCLGMRGRDVGKVYFHNHNIGWHADAEKYLERGDPVPPDIRYQTVCEVAPSFEQFILNMVKET